MYKQLLAVTFSALILTACGGSDSGGGTTTGGTPSGGPTTTGTTVTGVSGDFGDAGSQDNAIRGVYNLCPAGTNSFSTFAEVGGNWCVPGCPAVFENDDNDEYGSFPTENGQSRYTCFITDNAPGSQVEIFFSAAVNGCPAPVGCPEGTFPPVYISAAANVDDLAGTYNCADWSFDVDAQDWGNALTTPAPFTLTLNTDQSANISGTDTSWSFANGLLTLEGNRVFNNVAVGSTGFTEYHSNTYITRCKQ